jgi:hypothetical protein
MLPSSNVHQDTPSSRRAVVNVSQQDNYEPGGIACCVKHVILAPCMLPCLPCCLLDLLCSCGCRASCGESKQTIQFDYAEQMVTLRQYVVPYCGCEWDLVIVQQLPIDRIDSFKCVKKCVKNSAANGFDSTYVAALAVRRSLEPDPTEDIPISNASSPPYAWPFFIDRATFEGGDLLLLSVFVSGAKEVSPTNLNNFDNDNSYPARVYVSADSEKLLPIVDSLNMRLSLADEA